MSNRVTKKITFDSAYTGYEVGTQIQASYGGPYDNFMVQITQNQGKPFQFFLQDEEMDPLREVLDELYEKIKPRKTALQQVTDRAVAFQQKLRKEAETHIQAEKEDIKLLASRFEVLEGLSIKAGWDGLQQSVREFLSKYSDGHETR